MSILIDYKDIVVGGIALLLALFYFKAFETKLIFVWIAVALISMGLSDFLPSGGVVAIIGVFTAGLGVFQAFRKKDKIYGILALVIALLVFHIFATNYIQSQVSCSLYSEQSQV